jgi:transposase-like protein
MIRSAATAATPATGVRSKTVLTEEIGPVEIEVPGDVEATFTPQIVQKRVLLP